MFKSYSQRKASYNHQKQAMSESFKRQLTDFTTTYPHKKSKLPPMPLVQSSSPFHSQSSVSELSSPVVIPHNAPSNHKPKHYRQQRFDKAIGSQLRLQKMTPDSEMDFAIANWIHSKGLPFSTSDDPMFHHVIQFACLVNPNYTPPSRKKVSGDLLDHNFKMHIQRITGM